MTALAALPVVLFGFLPHPPVANRAALVDGTPGVDIYPALAPAPGEHVIKKHRYSGFFGTDLDIILREWDVARTEDSARCEPPKYTTPRWWSSLHQRHT